MTKFAEDFKKRAIEREQNRIGDVYAACEKRGCSRKFLEAFNNRAEHTPVQQTKIFIDRYEPQNENVIQWEIYLSTLIELRPQHENIREIKRAYNLILKY